jgi:polygalacturonase
LYFPPGKYLTGAINLKSNVTLHIEAGAVILGSPEVEDYPLAPDPWGEQKQQISALIYGTGIENITLAGRGVIDGQGGVWWNRQRLANPKAKQALSKEDLEEAGKVRFGRPHLIKLIRCRNVHIADCHIGVGDDCVTIKSGKDEAGRRVGKPCENITVTNCTMIHGHGGVVVGSEMSGGPATSASQTASFRGPCGPSG